MAPVQSLSASGAWAIAFETYGRWGSEGLNVLRSRAKAYVAADPFLSRNSWAVNAVLRHWTACLGIALQRANARSARAAAGACMPQGHWAATADAASAVHPVE